eukprot:1332992-Amorphochlora_amoeboformis.AAC.1
MFNIYYLNQPLIVLHLDNLSLSYVTPRRPTKDPSMRLLRALRRAARPNVHGKAFRFSPTPKHYRMAFVGTVGAGASLLAVMAMPVAHAEEIAADGSSKQVWSPGGYSSGYRVVSVKFECVWDARTY